MKTNGPVVIVLAAGRGRRFLASGGAGSKLQADLHGKPVLDHVLAAVERSGLAHHVVHRAAGDGMADSIAAGVRATATASGWLILPGDLPLISAASLSRVAQALLLQPVVVPTFEGGRGHPVGFAGECYAALAALSGEAGGAAVVERYRREGRAMLLPLDDPGILTDVDTLAGLQRAHALLAAR
ncbi:nucleotidyltransferase family protein [Pseudomonas fulva]|uniref:nucleotidyltransferase family protein n=1 Tax=Pseudomonas fulva TaxID=47880 RepID=UPI00201D6A70|nr:nucleotidyltransferase family protein [Pseudomonas fulva]UQY35810.1 nucleotidyltransferase family protein [Pseudomonas fulva]